MKVSYYELLGMIKENKHPEKVVYDDIVYTWHEKNYKNTSSIYLVYKFNEINMFDKNIIILDDIETVEEDKEIEEMDETQAYLSSNFNESVLEDINIMQRKINELIREVNKIKKEGK